MNPYPLLRPLLLAGPLALAAAALPVAASHAHALQPSSWFARKAEAPPKAERVARPKSRSLEYRLSWGLASIKADGAYARGFDGRGITVAMIDAGPITGSRELFGSLSPASTDLIISREGAATETRHGQQTGALVAAALDGQGTVGVAYGATLLSIRIDAAGSCKVECYARGEDLARGIDYALANGARIIGVPMVGKKRLPSIEKALARATAAGAVIVTAAGNDGGIEPAWPGRYAADPRFSGAIVVAGASDIKGQLAQWSNKAGALSDRYIAAPGENLLVQCDEQTCQLVSGTSYSVSYVAGALSLVLAANPRLSAQQAAAIVLRSAADRGRQGPDVLTGTGLLDVERALKAAARSRPG